jgi:cyclopropane fatty-acyl-phospholipid synthase-like methyltransferase
MWEARFATDDYVFGTEPAAFLRDHAGYLTPGATALSVADGEGRNAVYLAERGLQVTALEYAPSAIAKAQKLAAARGVTVDIREVDVLHHDWAETFDLVLGIFIQFVGPAERASLFAGMTHSTRPGGLILLHGYTPKQLDYGTGGPRAVENLYTEAMLRAAFEGWDILECRSHERVLSEGKGHAGRSALIDFIARKPG